MSDEQTTANQTAPPPSMGPVPVRKCTAETVLPTHVLDMLRMAPENPQFRTMVNAIVLQPVPEEAKTYEQIIDWVEFNIDPSTIKHRVVNQVQVAPAPLRNAEPQFTARVEYSYTEYGRCSYQVNRAGSDTYELSLDLIRQLASNADDLGELVVDCAEHLRQEAIDNSPDTDACGDYEHYDYESGESDNDEYEVTPIRESLREFVRTYLPAEFERLTEDEDPEEDDDEGREEDRL